MTNVSFTEIPTSGAPDAIVTVCWHIDGNGTIPETSIITDTIQPNRPDHPDFVGPTYYPDNATRPAIETLPNNFCTGVRLPGSGVLYVSAHATSNSTKTEGASGLQTILVNGSATSTAGLDCGLQLSLNRTQMIPGEKLSVHVHFRACENGVATNMPVFCGNEGPWVQLGDNASRLLPLWRSDIPWPEGAHSCPAMIIGAPPFGAINVTKGNEFDWNFSWLGEWRWTQDGPAYPAPAGATTMSVHEQNFTAEATVHVLPPNPCVPLVISTQPGAVYVSSYVIVEVTYTACTDETVDLRAPAPAPTVLIDNVTVTLATPTPTPISDFPPAPGPTQTHVPQGESRTFDYIWNGTWERRPGSGVENVPAGNYTLTTTYGPYNSSTSITWLRSS